MKIAIYDNDGKTADRYTFIPLDRRHYPPRRTRDGSLLYACLGCSAYPSHPQGFSQFSEAVRGRHLGRRVAPEDIPPAVLAHALARLTP